MPFDLNGCKGIFVPSVDIFCLLTHPVSLTSPGSRGRGPVPSVLRGVVFFAIPDAVVDEDGRATWERARCALAASDMGALPGMAFNGRFHVRPHATRQQPKMVLPDGTTANKQCFWINATYWRDLILGSEGGGAMLG